MLSLKTLPYLHRQPHSPFVSLRSRSSSFSFSAPTMASAVEHVVLFKVRDSTDPSVVDSMVTHLRSLSSLPGVAHLSAGPLLRPRSAAAAPFTHLLHSRYASKGDLASYAADPAHLAIVRDRVLPICDDIVALDWVADGVAPAPVPPGSAARLTLAKLNEGAAPGQVVEAMAAARAKGYDVSYGENFSPARAKGYSLGFLAVFPSVEAIDAIEGGEAEALKEKVRPLLESVIVADFVVSAPPAASL
ncbi:stress-response A/B barrel domain-containing protein UP3-like [Ananas comosus]|uniref:Stress-response A/B barrel domain-containing protein UP3-like n=1 Tax=Ananas comosus TaxID=4615 RepID=A0A199VI04_ANACO|nr:stress-response A/B barrel domain-containing protein UP3-like [Ananas comosus]OAY76734.1 hypothetical protein ACMD2_07388 [Ananas comosus]